jgi:hypothetical protein
MSFHWICAESGPNGERWHPCVDEIIDPVFWVKIYDDVSSWRIGTNIIRASKSLNSSSCLAYRLTYGSLP